MRLLDTSTLQLHEFYGDEIPKYAILSHRWEDGEVTLKDVRKRRNLEAPGWIKVRNFCTLAAENGYNYAWIDTCCIDKSSSAELTEAINSMYVWYQNSAICYVYFSDVTEIGHLYHSQWFTRGWTLQELLAPEDLVFIANDWKTVLGDRASLEEILAEITGIHILERAWIEDQSIATRMSWAAKRVCTREEDVAYSLLGIFGVNMPLLYGEGGKKAFMRLQLEILKNSDDESIFAWADMDPRMYRDKYDGMLAPSPEKFADSKGIASHVFYPDRPPYSMTNKGLEIQPRLIPHPEDPQSQYLLPLNCHAGTPARGPILVHVVRLTQGSGVDDWSRRFLRIGCFLQPLSGEMMQEWKLDDISKLPSQGNQNELIYIRQYDTGLQKLKKRPVTRRLSSRTTSAKPFSSRVLSRVQT